MIALDRMDEKPPVGRGGLAARAPKFAPTIAVLAAVLALGEDGVLARDSAPYQVRDCGQFSVQIEINACAEANRQAADAALNKIYRQLMAQQSDAAAKEKLKAVERAWIAYRDRECALEVGPQESGGSIWPMEMSNCLEEKTAARIRELRKLRGCAVGASGCDAR